MNDTTKGASAQVELMNCPFCGMAAQIATFRPESYGYHCETRGVKCTKCFCRTNGFEVEGYDWEKREYFRIDADGLAAAAWNTRA